MSKSIQDRAISDQITLLASRYDRGFSDVAARLGMSERTLRTRRQRPDTFTLAEIRRLCALCSTRGVEIQVNFRS